MLNLKLYRSLKALFLKNPYCQLMRLDKPVGIWLLLLPCLIGLYAGKIANPQITWFVSVYYSFIYMMGAVIMRSAGCVINDFFDRNIDKNVSRTQSRPLADGRISPLNAIILFFILSSIGLLILLELPKIAIIIGLCSFVPIILYPLMKRITYFPQLFLGFIYNIGIIMGYVTITKQFDVNILWLYVAGVFFTIAYDTIYAFQDIDDDKKIGVKSSAIKWQDNPKKWLAACYGLAFLSYAIFLNKFMATFFVLIIGLIWLYFLKKWNIMNYNEALIFFKKHIYLLTCLLIIIIIV